MTKTFTSNARKILTHGAAALLSYWAAGTVDGLVPVMQHLPEWARAILIDALCETARKVLWAALRTAWRTAPSPLVSLVLSLLLTMPAPKSSPKPTSTRSNTALVLHDSRARPTHELVFSGTSVQSCYLRMPWLADIAGWSGSVPTRGVGDAVISLDGDCTLPMGQRAGSGTQVRRLDVEGEDMTTDIGSDKGSWTSRWFGSKQEQPILAPVAPEVLEQQPLPGVGVSDLPAVDDLVGVDPYARGLSAFIAACPTPMTIAIQGGWGTGKTSTMKMVEKELVAHHTACEIVNFNTWQYEHTDLGEGLTYHLVKAILEQGTPPEEQERKAAVLSALRRGAMRVTQEAARAAVRAADAAAAHAASVAGGELGAKVYDAGRKSVVESFSAQADVPDSIERLIDVRADFAQVIRTRVTKSGSAGARVVVFIDDLDRLEPARAVEVMESLKALLDCPGCVFVLAVDFEVVQQGVRLKYRDMTNDKVRAFFDKIIQVPFHMPVSAYAMDKVIDAGLEHVDLSDESRELCRTVGTRAVDNNPRAAKRLVNSFVMLRHVSRLTDSSAASEQSGTPCKTTLQGDMVRDDGRLFTLLALKAAFPEFAEEAERISAESAAPFFTNAVTAARMPPGDDAPSQLDEWGVNPKDADRFCDLLDHVIDAFDMKTGRSARAYGRITSLTGVTSVGVRQLERTTILPADERAQRMIDRGVDTARVELAKQIEDSVRAAFHKQGMTVEGAESKNGTQWTLTASGAGRASARSGQIFFPAKKDYLQAVLVWRQAASPQGRDDFERDVKQLCQERRWDCFAGEGAGYIRVQGIRVGDDLSGLADLFVRAVSLGR